jgi:DNA-binding NarL/FixJ family response regulator
MTPIKPQGYLPSRLPAACRKAARDNLPCWRAHPPDEPLDLLVNLTPRQRQVAELVSRGFTNTQIGERLSISPETVRTHVRQVLHALGLHRKSDLVEQGPIK